MQDVSARWHRKQKSPAESLYGQINKSTTLTQDLRATCSKTQQGFSYKICVLPQNKDFMFYFPTQENEHFSSSPPLFSFYHYSELSSCEDIVKHIANTAAEVESPKGSTQPGQPQHCERHAAKTVKSWSTDIRAPLGRKKSGLPAEGKDYLICLSL